MDKELTFIISRLYQIWFDKNRETIVKEIKNQHFKNTGKNIDEIYIEEVINKFV